MSSPDLTAEQLTSQIIGAESLRAERVIALGRALIWTLTCVPLLAEVGTGRVPPELHTFIPALLGLFAASAVLSWGYHFWLRDRTPGRSIGLWSTAADVLLLWLVSVLEASFGGGIEALSLVGGMTPTVPGAILLMAAAALRQDWRATALAMGLGVPALGGILVLAWGNADRTLMAPVMLFWASPLAWGLRAVFFVATGALLVVAARNSQRMALQAGAAQAERTLAMQLFGRYVAKEIRDEVVKGMATAQLREATVLFTDLRDFTALSERTPPEALLELINRHFQATVPCVHAEGGTVNKFIGDALMATFGAPLHQPDHAHRAVKAAVAMLRATQGLNLELMMKGLPPLRMGVGIATGKVVVGTLGGADRVEYAVLGDTVNLASRLESQNKELQTELLLSAGTRAQLPASVAVRAVGSVKVKGKQEAVEVYALA